MIPKAVSTVDLRRAYSARPSGVCSRCAIDEVINLSLENGDTRENEIAFVRILDGARPIQIKEIHDRGVK